MLNLTREVINYELVPLLKTINEQVNVEDVTSGDLFYTDGTVQGSICKIVYNDRQVYLWSNGDLYCSSGIRNDNVMNGIKDWLSPKFKQSGDLESQV